MPIKIYLFILCFIASFKSSFCQIECTDLSSSDLILNTLNGKVKGKCEDVYIYSSNKSSTQVPVMTWLSIPYAEPPIGKLRFSRPRSVKSWSTTLNGQELPKMCIQKGDVNEMSEDCLYLNVYTPYLSYNASQLLPVFVWIHGGSWISGSGGEYDPLMISALSNVVSVTINYRVGAFGFLHLSGTDAAGNQLLYDQSLAIKWINENAARFGGDKSRITITGQSAGSSSVSYQLLFKQTWPFFRNAILQSGAPDFGLFITPNEADHEAINVANALGCTKLTNQDLLDCLQLEKDAFSLNKIALTHIAVPSIVYENALFTQEPEELFRKGDFKKCNILTGYTTYEQLSLAADEITENQINSLKEGDYQLLRNIIKDRLTISTNQLNQVINFYLTPEKQNNPQIDYFYYYVNIVSDYEYKCPAHIFSEDVSKNNKNIFTYFYDYKSSTGFQKWPAVFNGAAHSDELEFVFGTPLFSKSDYGSDEKAFSEQIIQYWTNFVKYDTPTLDNAWPSYSDTNSEKEKNLFYLNLKQNKNTIYQVSDKVCAFWNTFGLYQ
jgi:carboxylesterase type B